MTPELAATRQALRTPRAAAIAGIVFSVLLSVSLVLIRLAIPSDPHDAGAWVFDPAHSDSVRAALYLVPFAGIAFLWFIGVVRDRMGALEDRFFATVFLGSGLLFVAMLFVAAALAGGLLASLTQAGSSSNLLTSGVWPLGRVLTSTLVTYMMKMAAVFMISTATIALRIAIMPRWLGLLGYAGALVLLVIAGSVAWVELLFPLWVLLVSLDILLASLRLPRQRPARDSAGEPAPRPLTWVPEDRSAETSR
jgi:hypothetical protein